MQPAKQGLFSLIPEAAAHMNFAENFVGFFRTSFLHNIRQSNTKLALQKMSQILEKTPMLESLFNKAAGLKPENFLKRHFRPGVFLLILGNF